MQMSPLRTRSLIYDLLKWIMLTMGSSSALHMHEFVWTTSNQLIGIFQNLNKEHNETNDAEQLRTGNRNCMHMSSRVNSRTRGD